MTVIECQRCCDTDENDTPGHKAALVTTHPNLQATVTPSRQKQGETTTQPTQPRASTGDHSIRRSTSKHMQPVRLANVRCRFSARYRKVNGINMFQPAEPKKLCTAEKHQHKNPSSTHRILRETRRQPLTVSACSRNSRK